MMTNVMPTVTTPMTRAERRMLSRLSTVAKVVRPVDDADDDEHTSAPTRPRLRRRAASDRAPHATEPGRLPARSRGLLDPAVLVAVATSAPAGRVGPRLVGSLTRRSLP